MSLYRMLIRHRIRLNRKCLNLNQKKTIRRRYNPPEVQQAGRQMTEAFNILNNVINRRTTEVEDECDIFGKLIAKKLKKLPENKREDMMFEILSLFRSTNNSMPRPPSTDSYRSSTPELSTSIYNPSEIHSSYNPILKRPRSQNFTYAPAMVLSQKSPSSFSEPENRTTVSRSTLNTSYSLPAIPGSSQTFPQIHIPDQSNMQKSDSVYILSNEIVAPANNLLNYIDQETVAQNEEMVVPSSNNENLIDKALRNS